MNYILYPKSYKNATPLDVYNNVCLLNSHDKSNEVFFNMPITSSGARRLIPKDEKPSRNRIIEIALQNINVAQCLITAAAKYLPDYAAIGSSVDFGLWEGWGEMEYMKYWFYHISGIGVSAAKKFEDDIKNREHINHTVMNDYAQCHHDREVLYEQLLHTFCQSIKDNDIKVNPVGRMIALPDAVNSLGCRTEIRLAQFLGINISILQLDTKHDKFENLECHIIWNKISEVDDTFLIPKLEHDGSKLIHFTKLSMDSLQTINF